MFTLRSLHFACLSLVVSGVVAAQEESPLICSGTYLGGAGLRAPKEAKP